MLKCDGVGLKHEGKCGENQPCLTTKEFMPVCGLDNQTYNNMSLLRCA